MSAVEVSFFMPTAGKKTRKRWRAMMLHVLLLTVGFVFLVKGADWFVEGAAGIAKKLGILEKYGNVVDKPTTFINNHTFI